MLNTTNIRMGSNTSNVTFNTPSTGMMQRSHPKSFFIRFAKGSDMEDWVFPNEGKQSFIKDTDKYKCKVKVDIDVLQILVFGDNQFMCEVVKIEDLPETTI